MNENEFTLDYTQEQNDDFLLSEIRNFCSIYLLDNIIPRNITLDVLYISMDFLSYKFDEIKKLKDGLKIQTRHKRFEDIAFSLDEITINNGLINVSQEYTYNNLSKDVNYTISEISLLYGIINKMISELENKNDN